MPLIAIERWLGSYWVDIYPKVAIMIGGGCRRELGFSGNRLTVFYQQG